LHIPSWNRGASFALAAVLVFPSTVGAQEANLPGTDNPAPAQPPSPEATLRDDLTELRGELRAVKAQVEENRASSPDKGAPVARPGTHPIGYEAFWPWVLPPEGFTPGAYIQAQYESHEDSQDQLFQGGAPMNQDRFLVRRARVSVVGEWQYAAIALEIDANTTSGPQVDLRKAEASIQYRPDRSRPPIVMATLGQFDTPFGYELVESPRTRWFMERSTLSRAFWPGEPDLGIRLAGALGFFRWTIAPINGEPLGEKSPYTLQDPNTAKDIVFRFGVDSMPREDLHIAAGVSTTRGRGFHAGTDATKSTIRWVDLNEDGVVQPFELQAVPGQAATPSQNFDRWAAGLDLRIHYRSRLGITKMYAEFVLGANMDRALFVADPILNGFRDQRELGYCIGVTQEIGPYGVVGFRYDSYDPNLDASDKRGGSLIPYSQAITTYSPLVGVVLPDRARLLFQYDVVRDALARSNTGVPTDLKNNAWTVRLQVQL
jgi:hypothetical protein